MTFYYTHSANDLNSTAVSDAYYSEDTQELAVVLTSHQGYVYTGVPLEVFEKFNDTGMFASAGRHYAKTVKPNYGPGESMGWVDEYDFEESADEYAVATPVTQTVGTPKALVDVSAGSTYFNLGDTASTGNSSGPHLHVNIPTGVQRKHEVKFTIEGVSGARFFNTEAGSVNEAVEALETATAALGLDVTVNQVVVFFE